MTQRTIQFEPPKESQSERCRRVLAGVRGTVRVERAAVMFGEHVIIEASEQARKESRRSGPITTCAPHAAKASHPI